MKNCESLYCTLVTYNIIHKLYFSKNIKKSKGNFHKSFIFQARLFRGVKERHKVIALKIINIYKEDAIERKMLHGNYNCKYFFKLHSFMCLKVSCLYI